MTKGLFREGDKGAKQEDWQDGGYKDNKEVRVMWDRQKMNEEEEILLEREIHIMKHISHPNIVEFYDCFL